MPRRWYGGTPRRPAADSRSGMTVSPPSDPPPTQASPWRPFDIDSPRIRDRSGNPLYSGIEVKSPTRREMP